MGRERSPRIFEPGYYDRLREIERRHWWSRGMRRAMAALLEPHLAKAGPLRVLDAGCGTGVHLESARRWRLAGPPVGLDIAPEAIEHAGTRGIASLVRGDASELPFRAGAFDLVLCVDTIQHLSPGAAGRVVAEIRRVLRPGGLVYLRTNSALGHAPLRGIDPERYRRYDVPSVVALVETAGLEVLRATYLNAVPGMWGALLERMRGPREAPPGGPALSIRPYPGWLTWLDRGLGAVLSGEALLLGRLGLDLPFGHSTATVARRPGLDPGSAGS
ncbi:MAG: class I SAM-dependent methyltransferase [Gemmatimonadota bacterium]